MYAQIEDDFSILICQIIKNNVNVGVSLMYPPTFWSSPLIMSSNGVPCLLLAKKKKLSV